LVISQTGLPDGDPIDSTQGAGELYLLIATPAVLS
jgi:hypothetical protein